MALFPDFDWLSYRTDIWWYYLPRGLSYTLILYAIGGVLFSLLVQKIITYVSSAWKHYWRINDTELRPWRTNKMFQTLKNTASFLKSWSDGTLTGNTKVLPSARYGVF